MELEVLRFSSQKDDTLGLLFDCTNMERKFLCFILEDEYREKKVLGKTRIPALKYEVTLRTVGGMNSRYKKEFPDIHKGMLWVRDVPGFNYIYLIHIGNFENQTNGCGLCGDQAKSNIAGRGAVYDSELAYKKVYPLIANKILLGERVYVTYSAFDGKMDKDIVPVKTQIREVFADIAGKIAIALN